jgi:hypothetical protein
MTGGANTTMAIPPCATPPEIVGLRKPAFIAGGIALILFVIGGVLNPTQFLQSYLIGFLLWCGVVLGCMGLVMLQFLTGGAWGIMIRRPLEAATRTVPLLALFFLPIILGMRRLYAWTVPGRLTGHQAQYLNVNFFIVRAIFYFVVWGALAFLLNRWSLEQDRHPGYGVTRRLQLLAGPGIVIYGFTMTFAGIDWVMSLAPGWYSSIFGMLIVGGQGLGALAFIIVIMLLLAHHEPMADLLLPRHFHDLGKLLLAFVMIWAYFAFSQLLIIWAGNLSEEIPWYLDRLNTSWRMVGLFIVVFHFAMPFMLLLSRDLKRNAGGLAAVAIGLFAMRFVDLVWMTAPEFHHGGFYISWMDVIAPIALGGIWLGVYFTELQRRPLLPIGESNLQNALEHGEDE